jgi:hypothetical protein
MNNITNEQKKIIPVATHIHHFHHQKLKFLKNKSLHSKRSKINTLPELTINIAEDPAKLCKDDTFGIAITGKTFECIYILNERFIKKKILLLKVLMMYLDLFSKMEKYFRVWLRNIRLY